MDNTADNYDSDDSSVEDDPGQFHNEFESNRASLSDYEANRASLSDYETNNRASFSDYETNNRASFSDIETNNRASLSDYETNNRASFSDYESNNRASFESNRLSLSEQENALSDQESNKDFTEHNDHHGQNLSDSNSEEESKPFYQPAPTKGPVSFHKFGQETKVVYKNKSSASTNHSPSHKRHRSTDSEVSDEGPAPRKRNRYEHLARPTEPEPHTSEKAMAMMEKMGYTEGRGLGKHKQGRLAPVELSKQRGRRGLGLRMPGLEPENLVWDSSMEIVEVEEEAKWLVGEHLPALDTATLHSWKEVGPRNLNIDECNDFCEPDLLNNVLRNKAIFDNLSGEEMRRARARSNPFETIGKGMFLNRAAMKMANMDRVFDFMFTQPKTKTGEHMVKKNELLYFADVCAGPGGFSEYVLWRKQWRAKGFGFTLKGENDFKLSDFFSGPCESFEPFYGVKEDGDVFEPKNIESLMHFVMDHTGQQGVHFMMADGGFSVDGQENIQELLSKQLYLCQFLVALCIVRTGGHFVCKLFDIFSPFSVGLVYLMYRAFERISIHKPNTSRPANSERYIICKWKRDDCEPTRQYMFELNKELCQLSRGSAKEDINLCVAMDELTQDSQFFDYIVTSNNELGERQVINLIKIQAFCRDMGLTEPRQADMRRRCLDYWGVVDVARRLSKTTAEEIEKKRLEKCGNGVLTAEGTALKNEEDLKNAFKSVYDWNSIPVASQDIHFIIGLGRNKVLRLAQGGKFWKKLEGSGVELSPGTMLYGEIVTEYQGVGRSQVKKMALHIIDALSLGNEDVSQLFYTERLNLCRLYAESLNKTTRTDLVRLRVKIIFPLEDIHQFFKGLTVIGLKNGTKELMSEIDGVYYQPKGVIFFKTTKEPYRRFISSKTGGRYYHKPPNINLYDAQRPADACASTVECISKRQLWIWQLGAGLHQEPPEQDVLHKDQLLHFISNKLKGR